MSGGGTNFDVELLNAMDNLAADLDTTVATLTTLIAAVNNLAARISPLYQTSIIGSDEPYFNGITDEEERQKTYAAGDSYTSDWTSGKAFYPNAITAIFRAAVENTPRPPCRLRYEGIFLAITTSDGRQVFAGTLGQEANIDWDIITVDGTNYYQALYKQGQGEFNARNVTSDVSLTVLVKNNSGVTLDQVIISLLGATYEEA